MKIQAGDILRIKQEFFCAVYASEEDCINQHEKTSNFKVNAGTIVEIAKWSAPNAFWIVWFPIERVYAFSMSQDVIEDVVEKISK